MMRIRTILLLSCLGLFIIEFFPQTSNSNDTYLGIGTGRRTIAKTEKKHELPVTMDSALSVSEVKYYMEPKKHEVEFNAVPIRPAKLKIVEPLDKLYSGYIKGAAGTYLMPYLEVYYNSTRSKRNSWGINGLHHSALGNIKDVGVNKFSDNKIGGYYKHFLQKQDVKVDLNYERNSYHYYGFSSIDSIIPQEYIENADTTLQVYNLLEISGEFTSRNIGRDTSKLNYKGWLNYHLLNSRLGTVENYFLLGGEFGKFLNKEEFIGSMVIDVNNVNQPQWDTAWIQSENQQATSAIIKLNPHIYSRGKNWKVKAGMGLHANITHEARFYFYPDLECSYSLFNDLFIPYLGVKGGMQRNNINTLRLENPFIADNAIIQNTNQKINIFGGIRGSVSSLMTFNLSAGFEKIGKINKNGEIENGMYFFVPDTLSSYENKYMLSYDVMDKTTISGQLTYQKSEKLKLFTKGEYFIYNPLTEDRAWQMPDFKLTFSGYYDIGDKIIIKGSMFFIGARDAYSYTEQEDVESEFINDRYVYKLKPFIDMNLGFEYRYNKRISAFILFNNFTAVKYQRWSGYPVQSINIFGGATFSF